MLLEGSAIIDRDKCESVVVPVFLCLCTLPPGRPPNNTGFMPGPNDTPESPSTPPRWPRSGNRPKRSAP